MHYEGVPVGLTPLQWRLLQCLVQNKGAITTYRELWKAGWENADLNDTRSVNVQISHLREKLHDQERPYRYLHTVREEGYSFEVR